MELRGKAIDRCALTKVQVDYCIRRVHRLSLIAKQNRHKLIMDKTGRGGEQPLTEPLPARLAAIGLVPGTRSGLTSGHEFKAPGAWYA